MTNPLPPGFVWIQPIDVPTVDRFDIGMKPIPALLGLALVALSCATAPHVGSNPPPDIDLLTRAEWGAKPPVAEMKRHELKRITIHHTATLQKPERALKDKLQALQNFSQHEGKLGNGKPKPAWPDVPYHYYIAANGEVAEGRDVNFVGDTNTEYDPTGHVLVVLEGNFEEEQVTDSQGATLVQLVSWLASRFHISPADVQGHKDYADTLCPGKDLHGRLTELRATLRRR